MRYSLSDYILAIANLPAKLGLENNTISVGGTESYLNSVSAENTTNMWSTEGDATGSWVHNKSLDRTGTVTIDINQMSPQIANLVQILNAFYDSESDNVTGMKLVLQDRNMKNVFEANDCYIQKIPSQAFGQTAATQSWVITCGQLTFK